MISNTDSPSKIFLLEKNSYW